MIIHRILNNNVVVVLDKKGEEQIVTGRGIAYNRKVGDLVEQDKITQVFYLINESFSSNIQGILKNIPIDVIEVSIEIVAYARKELNIEITDSVIFSLMDHINSALERAKNHIQIPNIMEWDIKRFYPLEYKIGKEGLKQVNEKLNVQLSKHEASFIALHLANSQLAEHVDNVYDLTELMSQIINIVKYYYKSEIDEGTIYFDRFLTHLKFFCYRILYNETYVSTEDSDLYDMVKVKYINEYQCTKRIKQFIEKQYKHSMSKEEQLYLMIHIAKLVQLK